MKNIGNDKGRGRFETRGDANRIGVGNQDFVRILVPDISNILGVMAINGTDKNTTRNAQRFVTDRR